MGILDSNSRWVDIILTEVGKRALAEGDLDIRYYSFSDMDNSYLSGGKSGTREWLAEPHSHLMLEAHSKPQDQATIASDAFGERLVDSEMISVVEGGEPITLVGDSLNKGINSLKDFLKGSATNLSKNCTISTTQPDNDFIKNDLRRIPLETWENYVPTLISSQPPIWNDADATALPQFKYLPPIVDENSNLGDWPETTIKPSVTKLKSLEWKNLKIIDLDLRFQEITIQPFIFDENEETFNILTILRANDEYTSQGSVAKIWHIGYLYYHNQIPKFLRIFTVVAS